MNFNKINIVSVLFIVIFSGCGERDWQIDCSPENYSCTQEQFNIVQKDFNICKTTNYKSEYCFCQAKKSNCTEIKRQ